MRFDFERQQSATPYAGRHRKGRLQLRAGLARGYLQRARAGSGAANGTAGPPGHRGPPAVYDEQRPVGR